MNHKQAVSITNNMVTSPAALRNNELMIALYNNQLELDRQIAQEALRQGAIGAEGVERGLKSLEESLEVRIRSAGASLFINKANYEAFVAENEKYKALARSENDQKFDEITKNLSWFQN